MGSFLLFLICCPAISQSYDQILAVDPIWGAKRERIYLGDPISVKCADNSKFNGILTKLEDSTIYIDNAKMHLKEIVKVTFNGRKEGWGLLSAVCLRAGLGYFAIVGINGVINDDSPIISDQTIKISGGILAVGLAAALFNRKSIRIKHNWQLKVIDLQQIPIEK